LRMTSQDDARPMRIGSLPTGMRSTPRHSSISKSRSTRARYKTRRSNRQFSADICECRRRSERHGNLTATAYSESYATKNFDQVSG
jgi:hypothetical protein